MDKEEKGGTLKISDDILILYAMDAAQGVKGMHSFAKKGIRVSQSEEGVVLDLYIEVDFGVKIPEVAWNVQKEVKQIIETQTALPVKAVNINVQGVNFGEETE